MGVVASRRKSVPSDATFVLTFSVTYIHTFLLLWCALKTGQGRDKRVSPKNHNCTFLKFLGERSSLVGPGISKMLFLVTIGSFRVRKKSDKKYYFFVEKSGFKFSETRNFPRPEGFTRGFPYTIKFCDSKKFDVLKDLLGVSLITL